MLKAYHGDGDLYSGKTEDKVDRKHAIFIERWEHTGIMDEYRCRAFSIMLNRLARQFYFDSLRRRGRSIEKLVRLTKGMFQTAERVRTLLRGWDSMIISNVMAKNNGKSAGKCLEILINRLQDIRFSLPIKYRNETIMRNKLLNAVKDIEQ